MFILMVLVFVLGYMAIALEHPIKIDKAASSLLIGALSWAILALSSFDILMLGHNADWNHLIGSFNLSSPQLQSLSNHFVGHELEHHLIEIAEILFFLLGAMTIVETVDHHQGFNIITDRISTKHKVKLLWILGFTTFFMSAALDNLTTTIVMIALLRKLVADKNTRWFYASIIVIAANAGGAWSPIGDVTTIMLWIGGQITAAKIISTVFLPSLMSMIVPLITLSFILKGHIESPKIAADSKQFTSRSEQLLMLIVGVSALLFVPVFKTITHLPPYIGMLLGLAVIWILSEILNKKRDSHAASHLAVGNIIKKVDVPTVMFFLGILSAVAALQTAGHLSLMSIWLDQVTNQNIYLIDTVIGILSSIVDNVPLVAGTMGMYEIAPTGAFATDGVFWELLAFTAGTGGSILIIGSAAGVAAMGMEKIDFIWYMKKISWLALVGYFAGIGTYYVQQKVFGHDQIVIHPTEEKVISAEKTDVAPDAIIHLDAHMQLEISNSNAENQPAH